MQRIAQILKPRPSNHHKYVVCITIVDENEVALTTRVYGYRDNHEDAKKLAHNIKDVSKVIYANGKSKAIGG